MLAQRTRRCKWLIVQMHVSVKKTERFHAALRKKRSVFTRHCETEVDEFAPYERASEPGKPEVYRAFAGA